MKTLHSIYMIAVLVSVSISGAAQDYPDEYLGLPGDNLNLYAVMNLFQESETLEGFERSLNDNEAVINNLDLNGDKYVDYITVSDYQEGDAHTIVLRTALNQNEQQDIAVFFVEKLRNGEVQIQLVGDEALYGPNYIVEPFYAETPNPGYTGKVHSKSVKVVNTSYYNIVSWPVVTYMYNPGYRVWRSSWYWGYYPSYWRPWTPHYWHYYYGYHNQWHNHYYSHYRHWDHYRSTKYKTYYHSHVRVYSPTVVVNINQNRYKSTYSRPDRRSAGAEYYKSTASRRSTTSTANRNNTNAVRTTTTTRSSSSKNTPAVERSTRSSSANKTPAVQRSSSGTNSKSKPSIQPTRSSSSRSSSAKSSKSERSSGSVSSSSSRKSSSAKSSSTKRSSRSSKKSDSKKSSTSKRSSRKSSSSTSEGSSRR